MKVVILAGGFGTRLSEYTEQIPKPMVTIGGRPILHHIMKLYSRHGFDEFILALGYKAELVKEYFLNYRSLNSDFTVNLSTGKVDFHDVSSNDWKVTLVNTGLNSMTGGRVKRLKSYINNETFLLTYGDGVSDVNIEDLVKFHKKNKKMVTVTAVHPGARFGELEISENNVRSFKEKPQTTEGWINGGFFVMEPEFLDLIEDDNTILEREPLESVAEQGQLMAFKHTGYWQCMDTKRDRDAMESLWLSGNAPWDG